MFVYSVEIREIEVYFRFSYPIPRVRCTLFTKIKGVSWLAPKKTNVTGGCEERSWFFLVRSVGEG